MQIRPPFDLSQLKTQLIMIGVLGGMVWFVTRTMGLDHKSAGDCVRERESRLIDSVCSLAGFVWRKRHVGRDDVPDAGDAAGKLKATPIGGFQSV